MTDDVSGVVLDASAVLALLFDEPGAAKVRQRIHGGLLGTTNMAEILAKLIDRSLPIDEAVKAIGMLGVEVVPFSEVHARASSAMRLSTRSVGCRSAIVPALRWRSSANCRLSRPNDAGPRSPTRSGSRWR